MNCGCHGEPAYWQVDRRCKAGGWWECGVKRREISRRAYEKHGDKKRAQRRVYYFERGWKVKRLNDLRRAKEKATMAWEALDDRAVS